MFRKKTPDADQIGEPAPVPAPVQRLEPVEEEPKPPVRRPAAIPARPLSNPGFPVDAGRRVTDVSPARADPPPTTVRDKCLLVGKHVKLKGEVPVCDKVMVEGEVELQLSGCRTLQVGPLGVFRGSAEVAEADIAGLFEGEIVARERLSVRSTARMNGKISYGQITIEAGGRVTGEIIGLQPTSEAVPQPPSETRPAETAAEREGAAPAEAVSPEPEPPAMPSSVRLSFAADDRP